METEDATFFTVNTIAMIIISTGTYIYRKKYNVHISLITKVIYGTLTFSNMHTTIQIYGEYFHIYV